MAARKIFWLVVSLPIAVVLYALAVASYGLWALLFGSSGAWSVGFLTVVEASDSAGLSTGLADLAGLGLTVLAWGTGAVVAGLNKGRWQPALAVGVLLVPLVAVAGSVRSAYRTSPNQVLAEQGFSGPQIELMHEYTRATTDYRTTLSAWLGALPGGARVSLPPTQELTVDWRGVTYRTPFEGIRVVVPLAAHVDAKGARHLVALTVAETGEAALADLPADTGSGQAMPVPFARPVDGAAVSPDGARIAYRTGAPGTPGALVVRTVAGSVVAQQPGVSATVVGWNTTGIVTRSSDLHAVQVWQPPAPGAGPATLSPAPAVPTTGFTDVVQAPAHSDRLLLRQWRRLPATACPAQYSAAAPFGDRPAFAPYRSWPPTYPGYRGGCLSPGPAGYTVTAPAATQPLWSGTAEDAAQSISDDGRYLVLGDLEVVDLTNGTRTRPAPQVTEVMRRLDHALTAIWGAAGDGRPDLAPLATGFWQGPDSVEVTAGGTVIAVCTIPAGPCRSTGRPLPVTATGP